MNPISDKAEIKELIQQLANAHADRNATAIVEAHVQGAVIYDLASPLWNCRMKCDSVAAWLSEWDGAIRIDAQNIKINVKCDLAFATSLNRIQGQKDGGPLELWYRSTICLRKSKGRWRIVHDHSSMPFFMDGSYRAAIGLQP
ncbi:MAG: YybH family protein [Desulfobacterales bacterium]